MGVISIFGSQNGARNIEQSFTLGHKNIKYLREALDDYQQHLCPVDSEASNEVKSAIEADCETTRVTLDPRVPNKMILFGKDLLSKEEMKLLSFLDKNINIFAWSTSDLIGVSKDIIEHKLLVNLRPRRSEQRHN
jgi:hypothetical protein